MNDAKRKKEVSKRAITFSDLIKFIGVLAVFLPVWKVILQYRQSIQQGMDENFRAIVERLSSEDKEKRLAAASSIGTFIIKGGKFHDDAIDILINKISIELDYNVLNTIRGSLKKIEKEDYKKLIDKLLGIERTFFIQQSLLKDWRDNAKSTYEESKEKFLERADLVENNELDVEKQILSNLKNEMNLKWKIHYERERDYNELLMHHEVLIKFLSIFLRVTEYHHIEGLKFFRNTLEGVQMLNLNLSNSDIKYTVFYDQGIWNTKFDNSAMFAAWYENIDFMNTSFTNCKISHSFFNHSTLPNVDFTGSEFKHVFFIGSDLTKTKFNNVEGLEPINFFAAENWDKAIFDPEFKNELEEKLENITEDEFIEYFENIVELSDEIKKELYSALDNVRVSISVMKK